MKYYAVAIGRKVGIFTTWDETKSYVSGFPNAKYKSFATLQQAQEYLTASNIPISDISIEVKEEVEEEIKEEVNGVTNLQIYTDGSCVNYSGGYAYIYIFEGKESPYYGKIEGKSTNQVAELMAIREAIKNLNSKNISEEMTNKKIDLYTDSMYSIDCITKWKNTWEKNGWKNSKGQSVINKELIQEIIQLCKTKNIHFHHVYGHKGNKYNEMCDVLANKGRCL